MHANGSTGAACNLLSSRDMISHSFLKASTPSYRVESAIDNAELKFNHIFKSKILHTWGNKPMFRSMISVLKNRTNDERQDLLLYLFLHGMCGDSK